MGPGVQEELLKSLLRAQYCCPATGVHLEYQRFQFNSMHRNDIPTHEVFNPSSPSLKRKTCSKALCFVLFRVKLDCFSCCISLAWDVPGGIAIISWIPLFRGREDFCASGGGKPAEPAGGADAGDAFEAAVCPVPLGSTGIHRAMILLV